MSRSNRGRESVWSPEKPTPDIERSMDQKNKHTLARKTGIGVLQSPNVGFQNCPTRPERRAGNKGWEAASMNLVGSSEAKLKVTSSPSTENEKGMEHECFNARMQSQALSPQMASIMKHNGHCNQASEGGLSMYQKDRHSMAGETSNGDRRSSNVRLQHGLAMPKRETDVGSLRVASIDFNGTSEASLNAACPTPTRNKRMESEYSRSGGQPHVSRHSRTSFIDNQADVCENSVHQEPSSASHTPSRNQPYTVVGTRHRESPENMLSDLNVGVASFDICIEKRGSVKLNPPLSIINREEREERKRSLPSQHVILGPGLILLKKYINHCDQVEIIKQCRQLGIGPGGFYRPGYNDGAKLNLQMMGLGKNWDPTTKYEDVRSIDGAKPPKIPDHFNTIVQGAIQESHNLIKKTCKVSHAEDVLPKMFPDLCIVNFYSKAGKLGLHQDKDESPQSLNKGLPVVSFSLGDSAEFIYGITRDASDKVMLESGDVLIFGGKSRMIYHGVTHITPGTAPRRLIVDTGFRSPGRLNLTFRQY
ncbi:hypothetical protein QJS10_CPB21g01525 [Acorus calamus]|uniref:Fe2OG dioxygenase domain-containing protein n=1 Tax=Acorus calamus TaxID=4465 RepID=A0AAV9C883_ACOCL|nr:hypothetical protein QJS10_CPB21g01525 [Acorus calamus]